MKEEKSSEWTLERRSEAYEKVRKDEVGRLGTVQENTEELHGLLKADHRASRWNGRSHFVVCLPALQQFPFGGLFMEMATTERCAACGGQYERRAPNRILVVQLGVKANEAKVFRAHAASQGLCENLINALKLLANQQKDGDSPMQDLRGSQPRRSSKGIVEGL